MQKWPPRTPDDRLVITVNRNPRSRKTETTCVVHSLDGTEATYTQLPDGDWQCVEFKPGEH